MQIIAFFLSSLESKKLSYFPLYYRVSLHESSFGPTLIALYRVFCLGFSFDKSSQRSITNKLLIIFLSLKWLITMTVAISELIRSNIVLNNVFDLQISTLNGRNMHARGHFLLSDITMSKGQLGWEPLDMQLSLVRTHLHYRTKTRNVTGAVVWIGSNGRVKGHCISVRDN